MKLNVLVVSDDLSFLSELFSLLSALPFYDVTVCDDIVPEKVSHDAVILDMNYCAVKPFDLLKSFTAGRFHPLVFTVFSEPSAELIRHSIMHGARYYFVKPISPGVIERRLFDSLKPMLGASDLDERISSIFLAIGMPANIRGYAYLREAVRLGVQNPDILNHITAELYPTVARRFDTTPSKAERAIRHTLSVTWDKGRMNALNSLFGVNVFDPCDRPSNSQFIALIVDKLLLDLKK